MEFKYIEKCFYTDLVKYDCELSEIPVKYIRNITIKLFKNYNIHDVKLLNVMRKVIINSEQISDTLTNVTELDCRFTNVSVIPPLSKLISLICDMYQVDVILSNVPNLIKLNGSRLNYI